MTKNISKARTKFEATDFDNRPRPYRTPDIGADEYWPPGTLRFIYLPLVMK